MNKTERISTFVSQLGIPGDSGLDPCYLGFFECFNAQKYYEAHDVLEHLWLQKKDASHAFFKGLIQIAGAFVHLQKQLLRPDHPKDGRRLRPASRLFLLGMSNIESYGPHYMRLNVEGLYRLCATYAGKIIDSGYQANPWTPATAPRLALDGADTMDATH
jgi:Domain of unknown function (DUF309)